METLPYPLTGTNGAFCRSGTEQTRVRKLHTFTAEDTKAAKVKRQEKIAHWATLPLRQDFVDASFMRGVLKAAGLHSPPVGEPASTKRIRQRLRTIGIENLEITEAVGATVGKFLVLNPNLPLWAALSAILEATGRYDKKAAKFAEQEDLLAKDEDMQHYRVWPDGTVQEASEAPYTFMSDDYRLVLATDEIHADKLVNLVM